METVKVNFKQKDGTVKAIDAKINMSLLEVAHQNDIDLEGACEGSLACSTCHVILTPEWYDKVKKTQPTSEDEEDMLDLAFGLTKTSRLGCQVIMKPELDGLEVQLPSHSRNYTANS